MESGNNNDQKLKFGEWRPIGVCDNAPPGVQKAQMFTREDFLTITASDVDRENWRDNPQVMKVLSHYCNRLARQSTTTIGMKRAVVSKITLVGAIMKLGITPTLNRESQDGKLQLFQVEFEDKGLKKKPPWLLIIAILLGILLVLLTTAIIIQQSKKTKRLTTRNLKLRSFTVSFCDAPTNNSYYVQHLDEARRILQTKADDLLFKGRIGFDPECAATLPSVSLKEERFLKCSSILRKNRILSQLARSDLRKVNACQNEICSRNTSPKSRYCKEVK